MTTDAIDQAAATLREAYTGDLVDPLRGQLLHSLDNAYAVQTANTAFWTQAGRKVSGRKIGLTSKAVQHQLGVDEPDFGVLFADMERDESEEIAVADLQQPKIEAEIAFVLGDDLKIERPSLLDVIAVIDYALPAFEVVSSRIKDWDIKIVDTVADNASAGVYVLGGAPRLITDLDLHGCRMALKKGEETVSEGVGRACLGNPLIAVRWLARVLVERGSPLRAGDVILSGALGPMVPVQEGDVMTAEIEGLGEVTARFEKGGL
ncbi:MAG: fumarylacetoacetate hydrolase family protein [Pseudomonadota bacterium]